MTSSKLWYLLTSLSGFVLLAAPWLPLPEDAPIKQDSTGVWTMWLVAVGVATILRKLEEMEASD